MSNTKYTPAMKSFIVSNLDIKSTQKAFSLFKEKFPESDISFSSFSAVLGIERKSNSLSAARCFMCEHMKLSSYKLKAYRYCRLCDRNVDSNPICFCEKDGKKQFRYSMRNELGIKF